MKLFLVENYNGFTWIPVYIIKGHFRVILKDAQAEIGLCTRVSRIKTEAEAILHTAKGLPILDDDIAETEWVN